LFSRAFLLPEIFEKFVARHDALTLLHNKHILNGSWARQFSYQFFEIFQVGFPVLLILSDDAFWSSAFLKINLTQSFYHVCLCYYREPSSL
jgi:hypothetical protein